MYRFKKKIKHLQSLKKKKQISSISLICFNKTTHPHTPSEIHCGSSTNTKKKTLAIRYSIKRKFYFSLALDYRAHLRKYINWPSKTRAVLIRVKLNHEHTIPIVLPPYIFRAWMNFITYHANFIELHFSLFFLFRCCCVGNNL